MRVAIPVHGDRISPVFDVAHKLLVIEMLDGEAVGSNELILQEQELLSRVRTVKGFGIDVLICGALSRPLEAMLESVDICVIARRCGFVEEVLNSFMSGALSQEAFLMPGCRGQRRRSRRACHWDGRQ